MSEVIHHECGISALYWLDVPAGPEGKASKLINNGNVTPLMPGMLLDLQNRGQLAAGLSSYDPDRAQLLDTYKELGTVTEAFRMSRPDELAEIMSAYAGRATIGHTRYATSGSDDRRLAQPFERHHGRLWKWFTFALNGNLANYSELRDRLLGKQHYHFSLDNDTELIMHYLSYRLRGEEPTNLVEAMRSLGESFDGSYNLVFMDAMGRMLVARDPLGIRPLSWAVDGKLFAAASESVALANLGFTDIKSLEPGQVVIVENGRLRIERFAPIRRRAHCFFEWVYFANVASKIDGSNVYLARSRSGTKLAEMEDQPLDESCIVVPVPDTAKAAADSYAFHLGVPAVEGLIRNRYIGRTFIEPSKTRGRNARGKYTALPEVLRGKRVFLVEDSIVRSTTLRELGERIRRQGQAKEVHVRVACPPIMAPCFYGIDMSTLGELFAPRYVPQDADEAGQDALDAMAKALRLDSLRYLPIKDLGECLQLDNDKLCLGCVTGKYPTVWGDKLYRQACGNLASGDSGRTYEAKC